MTHGVVVSVARIILHERFVSYPMENDIAVVVLATELPINDDTIRVAALPPPNKSLPFGDFGTVSGW